LATFTIGWYHNTAPDGCQVEVVTTAARPLSVAPLTLPLKVAAGPRALKEAVTGSLMGGALGETDDEGLGDGDGDELGERLGDSLAEGD